MKLINVRDCNENEIYGVILSQSTTPAKVQEIIDELKTEVEDYSTEDMRERLPYDCLYIPFTELDENVYI